MAFFIRRCYLRSMKTYGGGFLYDPAKQAVLLHLRDGNTAWFPHQWHFFGGNAEGGEDGLLCFVRELGEEIEYGIRPEEAVPLLERTYDGVRHSIFYVLADVAPSELRLHEGAGFGWIPIDRLPGYDLSVLAREAIALFVRTVMKKP